jgi:Helix-turn-helix domain
MKAKIRAMMNLTDDDRKKLAEWLTLEAVRHIIGKGRTTVHNLVKDGTLKQIGHRSSARISLQSVLAYIEQQREVARAAKEIARTVPNVSEQKAIAWARQNKAEKKLARAVEIVNAGQPTPATPGNITGDPRLDPVVFDGVCMARFEMDAILDAQYRAQRNRRYVFTSMRGI